MEFDSTAAESLLTRKLAALHKAGKVPAPLLDLIERVALLQLAAESTASPALPGDERLASPERRCQGAPILPRDEFPIDMEQAGRLFEQLLDIAAEAGEPMRRGVQAVRAALADGSLDLDAAFKAHLAGDETFFADFAERTPDSPRLLPFLVQAAMAPSLRVVARRLGEPLREDRSWAHGHCPTCGSLPAMATLREKEGFRFLSCSFCNHEYRAKRIMCPFCNEERHEKLEYFTTADEPGYQLHVCGTCGFYLKTADFRSLDKLSLPLLDDVESLALDMVAAKRGWRRPTLSGWGF